MSSGDTEGRPETLGEAINRESERRRSEMVAVEATLLRRLDDLEEAVKMAVQAYISARERP